MLYSTVQLPAGFRPPRSSADCWLPHLWDFGLDRVGQESCSPKQIKSKNKREEEAQYSLANMRGGSTLSCVSNTLASSGRTRRLLQRQNKKSTRNLGLCGGTYVGPLRLNACWYRLWWCSSRGLAADHGQHSKQQAQKYYPLHCALQTLNQMKYKRRPFFPFMICSMCVCNFSIHYIKNGSS